MWDETDPVFTIIWKIKNFSFSCYNSNLDLYCPVVKIDSLKGTLWNLKLELDDFDENYIGIFLQKVSSDYSPAGIAIGFEISLLSTDGTFQYSDQISRHWFKSDCPFGFEQFVIYEKLSTDDKSFLPHDILTIRCRMWKNNFVPMDAQQCILLTKIASHRSSFIWIIRNFSSFSLNQK
ncbi:MATH domain-containing protein [Trichonephila clavipes]|nr:MATH domain-containing protein [Trichonephila clavipes]